MAHNNSATDNKNGHLWRSNWDFQGVHSPIAGCERDRGEDRERGGNFFCLRLLLNQYGGVSQINADNALQNRNYEKGCVARVRDGFLILHPLN